jgi:hypothetical protein
MLSFRVLASITAVILSAPALADDFDIASDVCSRSALAFSMVATTLNHRPDLVDSAEGRELFLEESRKLAGTRMPVTATLEALWLGSLDKALGYLQQRVSTLNDPRVTAQLKDEEARKRYESLTASTWEDVANHLVAACMFQSGKMAGQASTAR